MKRALLLAALCLALALPAFAAEGTLEFTVAVDPAALLAAAPAPQPGEDGLVVYEAHHYRYADGLMSHRHQRLLRVTTEWALERLADPRLRFDSARQKITVHAARTYFPGGAFVDSPANAFNTVTPGELALAPDFLDIQELVITHVGLEPGCALWLDTEIVDTAPAGLPQGALLFPQGEFPVLEAEVISEGLYAELINPEGGPLALPAGQRDGVRTRWHFENLPAAPGQAADRLGDQLPHLVMSQVESDEATLAAIGASVATATSDTAGLGAWIAAVESKLERPFLDDRDALGALVAALGERTTLLAGQDWAWRAPRSVARVLETSLATPLERAAVMAAACRTRNLPSFLWLPRRWSVGESELLALGVLAAPLVSPQPRPGSSDPLPSIAPSEGRLLAFYEPLDGDSYGVSDKGAGLLPTPGRLRFRAIGTHFWNLGDGEFALTGGFEPLPRFWQDHATPETALRDWCAGWTDSSRVETLGLTRVNPSWVSELDLLYDITGRALPPKADPAGRVRLDLPKPPVDLSALLPPGMQRAQSSCRALLFPYGGELHLRWILELPADLEPVPVAPVDLRSGTESRFALRQELVGRRLTVDYSLKVDGGPVAPAAYPAFRALVNAALDPKATEVLLVPRAKD